MCSRCSSYSPEKNVDHRKPHSILKLPPCVVEARLADLSVMSDLTRREGAVFGARQWMTATPSAATARRRILHPIGSFAEGKDPEAEAALAKVKEEEAKEALAKKKGGDPRGHNTSFQQRTNEAPTAQEVITAPSRSVLLSREAHRLLQTSLNFEVSHREW
jgi:hypothetical protein